ncbi:hypothetical protein [Flavobacterium sp. SLB02]|uniref:hypothetical protein n=1 Tax=Flavobacterium sp. SLB02 TaxID=2665645 RepID=UPI0012AA354B|nr:hypothetical protein [Flavobacterium sp. SLB02]QGK73183.1 hypothetical protein GIY83_03625 [Flavobacterium sp. SLB02]
MKKILLLFLILFYNTTLQAQKTAAVMGDAAILIDLLKKDYASLNPETKFGEIKSDRERVIGIFKSYLTDNQKKGLQNNSLLINNLIASDTAYTNALNTYNSVLKVNISINNQYTIKSASEDLKTLQARLLEKKRDYYNEQYFFDIDQMEKIKVLYTAINPYLENEIKIFLEKYKSVSGNGIDAYAQNNYQSSINKSLPFLGGDLAFETMIDGLSRFLAKRIKEELTVYAIDKIKTYLNNPKAENYSQELMVILPKTTNYLKRFDSSQLMNFTNEMKQLIEQDLNNILVNAQKLKDLPKIQQYIAGKPDLEFAFEGLKVLSQISKVKNPVDYFTFLEESKALENWRLSAESSPRKYDIAQGLRLASMLAYSLTVIENSEPKFASIDFLAGYGSQNDFYLLYFGFLHQQNIKYFNIEFSGHRHLNFKTLMDEYTFDDIKNGAENFNFFKDNINDAVQYGEKIYTTAQSIKKKNKNGEEIKYEEIHGFVNEIIELAEKIVSTGDLLVKSYSSITHNSESAEINYKKELQSYFEVAKAGNDLGLDLHQKKYTNAITKAIEIPVLLKSNNVSLNDNLLGIKYLIEQQHDLQILSQVFVPSVSFTDIEKLHGSLEIIRIRWNDNSKLKALSNDLIFLESRDGSNYQQAVTLLRNDIKLYQNDLLDYYGIDLKKIKTQADNFLADKNQSRNVREFVEKKIDVYSISIFDNKVLHMPDKSISAGNELSEAFLAFAPAFVEKRNILKDGQALKIINFLNDIALASTAEDVEKAIDAFALPVGSSNLKERATSYYSINSFPGVVGGWEFTSGEGPAGTIGFTAPVGFYFQPWGAFRKGGSVGFFLPIIDIAAPVRLRLDGSNDTQTLPEFDFKDIFSPGFYVIYGFKNSPLAINFGMQYGPKLRDITAVDGIVKTLDSCRLMAGITIDIPLITLSGKYKD